jgi:hypothetical protein
MAVDKKLINGDGNQFGGGKNAMANEAGDGDGFCGSATQNVVQADQGMNPSKVKMGKPVDLANNVKGKK